MIGYPVYQDVPIEVSIFMKTKPQVFALLEMMVATVMISFLVVQNHYLFLLASPVFFIITGFIMILAVCKRNPCLVKTALAFNYINMVLITISLRFHLSVGLGMGMSWIVLVVCDVLVLIFSVVVVSTSCSCCCKSRNVAVSYMSAAVPVNNIVLLDQLGSSASPQPVNSGPYVMSGAYGQVLSAPLLNYGPFTSAPPPYYSPVPTAPPPMYDQAPVFYPPELRTQGQNDQIHQYVK